MASIGVASPEDFTPIETYELAEESSLWQDAWRRLRRNRLALVGAAFVVLVVVMAAVSHFWTPYPIWVEGLAKTYSGPSPAHPLGVDELGRDELSRLMWGAQIALEVGVGASALVAVVGVTVGLLAGFYRGRVDAVVSFLINIWYGVPDLLVVMIFVTITNSHSLFNIIIGVTLTRWMDMARLVRGQTFSLREREFVEAARASGTRDHWIIIRHILPNALGPIIVQATLLVPQAILLEAFLSYLGVGVPTGTPSWGSMASEGYRALPLTLNMEFWPAAALMLTLMAFNFLGDGLRDALDPRMKR